MSNFDLKTNRLDYGNLLAPVPGYALKAAIATTYSLDLQTLVASTISLGLGEATDSELRKNPLNLLAALLKVTDKTLIFCDATQIKSPPPKIKLLATLEKSLIPVSIPPRDGVTGFPSFHPKCWILQFENLKTKERKYRFITLSRNLTFDRSWDVSVALAGDESGDNQEKTEPIRDFIKFLRLQINVNDPLYESHCEFVDSLLKDLKNVTFNTEHHTDFIDYEVIPLGIGSYDINKDGLFSHNELNSLAIMSPFISAGTIKTLMCEKKIDKRPTLITRRSEIEKLARLPNAFDVYCLTSDIIDGEESVSEDDADFEKDDVQKQDIHAKVYVTENEHGNCLYLGSMNASFNGANRNVEMLIKLISTEYSPELFLKDIGLNDEKSAFERVSLKNVPVQEKSDEIDYEGVIKNILKVRNYAVVRGMGNDFYDIDVFFEGLVLPEYDIKIRPWYIEKDSCELQEHVVFKGLQLNQLSMFYEISVDSVKRFCLIPTLGIPISRDKVIVTDVISSKKKLAEYIAFVLGDVTYSSNDADGIDGVEREGSGDSSLSGEDSMTPIYERMLKAAYATPEKIRDIENVISMIDDEKIVTPEFKELYNTFKTVLGI